MVKIASIVLAGVAALTVTHTLRTAASQAAAQRPATPPQEPVPPITYRVDVSRVQIDAVVTDSDGRVIRDLAPGEFQIFEDGKPQAIDSVSFVEIPVEGAAPRRVSAPTADVRSNLRPFAGRLYVLLLDDLHTAAARTERVKESARAFVERNLDPGDLAAVVHVSGAAGANQDFTTDRELLLASIERFAGRKLPSETLNRIEDYNRQVLSTGRVPDRISDPDEGPRADDARRVFNTIGGIAGRLAPIGGRRKALLWFGEGVAYDMFAVAARTQASPVLESSRAAVSAASRANVAVYAVDARGLSALGDETLQLRGAAEDPTRKLDTSGLTQELTRSHENLRRLSNDTGGFAVVNAGDFASAFDRVVEENSAYYLLGYAPADERRDGRFRRVEVRVSRPGARVRARSGYVLADEKEPAAPKVEKAPTALAEALTSPIPRHELPMAIHAAPFAGKHGKLSVLLTVEYGASAFAPGVMPDAGGQLDVSVIAVTPAGKVEASDHATIRLDVKADTRQSMQVAGFRSHSRLELPPGRYQIRAAGHLAPTGLVGSVLQDLVLPDIAKARLALSGLVLTSMVAGLTPTVHQDDRMREVLPAPPTTARDFRNDEAIALFAEVYESGGTPSGSVILKTRVTTRAGEEVFTREDVRTAQEMKRSRGGYWLQISLRQFDPGDYVLELSAESSGAQPVERETAFKVWEVPARLDPEPRR